MTAKPRKRKKQRLSEHARLVEARAASIPPGVVHELFDTESVPQPPGPAPRRSVSPAGRFTSKPPPPPPRPSHAPDNDIPEADLDELDGLEELEELEETQTIIPTVSPRAGERAALPPSQRRSALPAVVLGSLSALGLGFAMFAERGDTKDEKLAVVAKEPAPPAYLAPPEPLAAQAPAPGPLAPEPASPAPVASAELAEPSVAEPTRGDAVAMAAAPALPSSPTEGEAPRSPIAAVNHQPASGAPKGGEGRNALPAFDPEFASAAIRAAFARAQGCRSGSDPTGVATVSVTYAPSGRVTRTLVDGTFAGTSTGSCIAATLRSATIPPFSGALVTIKQSAAIK